MRDAQAHWEPRHSRVQFITETGHRRTLATGQAVWGRVQATNTDAPSWSPRRAGTLPLPASRGKGVRAPRAPGSGFWGAGHHRSPAVGRWWPCGNPSEPRASWGPGWSFQRPPRAGTGTRGSALEPVSPPPSGHTGQRPSWSRCPSSRVPSALEQPVGMVTLAGASGASSPMAPGTGPASSGPTGRETHWRLWVPTRWRRPLGPRSARPPSSAARAPRPWEQWLVVAACSWPCSGRRRISLNPVFNFVLWETGRFGDQAELINRGFGCSCGNSWTGRRAASLGGPRSVLPGAPRPGTRLQRAGSAGSPG